MKKLIAILSALVLLLTGLCAAAGAETGVTDSYYEQQVKKFEEMKSRSISAGINNNGFFIIKKSLLYARKVTGVAPDGYFILGPWEVVNTQTGMFMGGDYFDLPGTCAMFAWSVDILAGTDWPYSGIFWTNIDEPVTQVSCTVSGGCRNVSAKLTVNGRTVYSCDDCDAHKEWKP